MYKKPESQPGCEQPEAKSKTEKAHRAKMRTLAVGSLAILGITNLQGDASLPKETLLQHDSESPHDEDTITVMTANVHYWTGAYEIGNNFSRIMEVIDEVDADVVCMQEFVDEEHNGERIINTIHEAGFNVYFSTTAHWPWRDPIGNAIISKAPFGSTETKPLPNPDTIPRRNATMTEIVTMNGSLSVTNTHLSNDRDEQLMQSDLLYPHIEETDILCGDLNQLPEELLASPLSNLVDPVFLKENSPTFPSKPNKPAVREVDYVVSSCGEPVPETLQIVNIDSDHFGRVQEIDFAGCLDSELMATSANDELESASE